jgi:hypothetical protein
LLAFAGDQLIGVRAFLRWEWREGDRVYRSVRAVDTATHPAHQGKGIFKRLTLALADACAADGVAFVFNTPNQQSRPGYLKMAWQDAGRLPVALTPVWPFGRGQVGIPFRQWATEPKLNELSENLNTQQGLHSSSSAPWLWWRYATVPVAEYFVVAEANLIAIYRLKDNPWGRELRITTCWDPAERAPAALQAAAKAHRARIISHAYPAQKKGWVRMPGPRVTVRPLSDSAVMQGLRDFQTWRPTLGDLELF